MQLRTDTNPVERIGDSAPESQFTIQANAKAFEILSAGIYTDPIAAVVRELSCNAYDAMVEAGKADQPFSIHLPTKLEPFFSVTDYGIGLSDENIRGLYSSYFQSTKTTTNDQIGAFGLGSKSPFSYSKAFDVISRFEGEQRTYTIFINEDGVPTISELANIPTTECNGITVKLAIRSQDYYSFGRTTERVLRFFPVKPVVTGSSDFAFDTVPDSAITTDKYIVDRTGYKQLTAVQGHVPYNVTSHQLEKYLSDGAWNFITSAAITLFFDIGMIDIAANREEIRYDETTCRNMAAAIEAAFTDYLDEMDADMVTLAACGSKWDIYSLLADRFRNGTTLQQMVGTKFKFTSDIANKWMKDGSLEVPASLVYYRIVPYRSGDSRAIKEHLGSRGHGDDRILLVSPANDKQVVLMDTTKRGSLRMNTKLYHSRHRNVNDTFKQLIAIIPITDRQLVKSGITVSPQDRATEYSEIVTALGAPEIKKISEWTDDVQGKARAARASGHTFKQFAPSDNHRGQSHKTVFDLANEPEDGGLYIEIDQLRNINIGGNMHSYSSYDFIKQIAPVINIINHHYGTNYKPSQLYGLTKKVCKYVSTNADWLNITDAYKVAIEDQKHIIEYYQRITNTNELDIKYAITKTNFKIMVGRLPDTSNFKSVLQPIIDASQAADALAKDSDHPVSGDSFNDQLSRFNIFIGVKHDLSKKSFIAPGTLDAYKMLTLVSFGDSTQSNMSQDYIEMVEK